MKIIEASEFGAYWKGLPSPQDDERVNATVKEIIAAVRAEGDRAVMRYAARFDRSSPARFEVPAAAVREAAEKLKSSDSGLASALEFAAANIRRFACLQREELKDFEAEIVPGIFTGQRVIPMARAAVYAPAGRFPLISTALMGLIPAFCAGVEEAVLASPPLEDGLPDPCILAAAGIAAETCGKAASGFRVFALGGAQAVAALALGTETVPPCDIIAGPGNKYVAAAKRLLFGEVGIDFVAGPTDVLIITAAGAGDPEKAADLAAADMLAQAEHDPDARARALVPAEGPGCRAAADRLIAALDRRLALLPSPETAKASLDAGGLIVIYRTREEALGIANAVAPEHLELQVPGPGDWIPGLKNYGSLFIGQGAAEVLGDYSGGLNHTLPTSRSARFTGGLSVRHFLKTVTTLRCEARSGYASALAAAEHIACAEGLFAHAESAACRER
jgi:histidinol dehydrogenase